MARLYVSVGARAVGSLGLCLVLLLAGRAPLAAQDSALRLIPESAGSPCPAPSETAYRLMPEKFGEHERWMVAAGLEADQPLRLGLGRQRLSDAPLTSADALSLPAVEPASGTPPCSTRRLAAADSSESPQGGAVADFWARTFPRRFEQAETEVPKWDFLERHRVLFSTLYPIAAIGAVTANSLVAYNTNHPFKIHHEGFFGEDTVNGGADKASHLTDYYVIASLFEDTHKMLGYSDNEAILWGVGLAIATGLANEVSDGFTRHGFSWEDLVMDSAGAVAAGLVSVTHTRDLLGMRTSHLPSSTYTHDVYSADFKFHGLANRLGVNLGPLRWLLFSVTYGAKGYRVQPPIEHQRQLGFEIGLNLQQILFDLKVSRSTWWGYPLHLIADNIRFPYTAVGMRVDLNSGKWHGPNNGNYP
jgi:Predicted periplasmic lipoprotein (DUF2279)